MINIRSKIWQQLLNPLNANFTKWSNTLKQIADEFFECVWPFCGIGAERVKIFVVTLGSCRKNGLIKKKRLIPKFMTSKPSKQTITIHILPNISQSKDNNEIWSVNRISQGKYFSSENMQKVRQGNSSRPLFVF